MIGDWPAWAPALAVAGLSSLLVVPLMRRVALATNFVDQPERRKVHRRPIPYLGGLALVVGVLAALPLESRASPRLAILVAVAALLSMVGLLDDDRTVQPRQRVIAQVAAAVLAVMLGVRLEATGVAGIDIVLTLVWIVGVTNAMNLIDNMDALAAGVAAVTGSAVFALAIAVGQPVVATLAAAVVGVSLGFLVYNRPPATIFMGDAGSLFLGFLLAVLSVSVGSSLASPVNVAVPLLLLGVPVMDTTVVTFGRLRRGRLVSRGGRDHLSHRLVAAGARRRKAVILLIAAQAVLALIAVLAGSGAISPLAATIDALLVVVVLVTATRSAHVYREPVTGLPSRVRRAVIGAAVGAVILSLPAVVALMSAGRPARAGAAAAERALAALRAGDSERGAQEFERAAQEFERAGSRLNGPLASVGLAIPGVSTNLSASRLLVSIGSDLASAGLDVASTADASDIAVVGGTLPLDRLVALTPKLEATAMTLERAHRRIGGVSKTLLAPPLADAVDDLRADLDREIEPARRAADGARLLPSILGGPERRTYFVAFQNNAELRGSGGFIGNFAELVAEDGRLELGRFGRLDDLNAGGTRPRRLTGQDDFLARWRTFNPGQFWQQINVSPDFPTTAEVISQIYPQSGGVEIDGVIALDPPALAALLELSGRVSVPGWPEPVSSTNVVDITLKDAYEAFGQDERVAFLDNLARLVTENFVRSDLGKPALVASTLAKATKGGHITVWMAEPGEQELMGSLGISGSVAAVGGDSLLVVNQNMAANKVDVYLRRQVGYDLTVHPDGQSARLRGTVAVTLANDAPTSGLSQQVIGPYDERFQAGENRTYVSVYTPLAAEAGRVDGESVEIETHADLGRLAQSATISIPGGAQRTFEVDVAGEATLEPGGWYRLDLGHQTSITPDEVEVSIKAPPGWRIAATLGLHRSTDRVASGRLSVDSPRTLMVRLARDGMGGVTDKLRAGDSLAPGPELLSRSRTTTLAPLVGTYLGLSTTGLTLFALTGQRRLQRRREREALTGIAYGRRRPGDFWTAPV